MQIEHKSTRDVSGTGILSTIENEGIVEALVSVTGVRDNVNDVIIPGAYEKTLQARRPKGVWSHDWNTPVSKAIDVKELMPGDAQLPKTLPNGEAWPAEAGALWVKAQFNLETQAGREAWSNVKFFGDDGEWSIGYTVPKGKATEEKSAESPSGKVRKIKEINLFEFSPVLFGAASNARTFASSIKSMFATDEARAEFIKALEEDEEQGLADEANAEGDVVKNTEDLGSKEDDHESEELLSGPEGAEEVKETRTVSVKVGLTAELFEQLTVLHKELTTILAEIKVIEEEEEEKIVIEPTDLSSAIEALVASKVDASTVEEIENKVKVFEKTIADGDNSSDAAGTVLDLIADALAGVSTDEEEKSLKVLASSVGLALKNAETAEVETKEDEPEEVEEKVIMSADDWKNFLNFEI